MVPLGTRPPQPASSPCGPQRPPSLEPRGPLTPIPSVSPTPCPGLHSQERPPPPGLRQQACSSPPRAKPGGRGGRVGEPLASRGSGRSDRSLAFSSRSPTLRPPAERHSELRPPSHGTRGPAGPSLCWAASTGPRPGSREPPGQGRTGEGRARGRKGALRGQHRGQRQAGPCRAGGGETGEGPRL